MTGMFRRRERLLSAKPNSKAVMVSFEQARMDSTTVATLCSSNCLMSLTDAPIQSVVFPSGFARTYGLTIPPTLPMIVQLSSASKHAVPSWNRTVVCSVLEALRSGADGVALQLAIGNEYEEKMLQDFAAISEEAHSYGLPVLLSIFAKGDRIVQEYDRALIADSIYLGSELGADIIAVPYSGHHESFAKAAHESTSPVLLTGTHGAANFDAYCKVLEEALNSSVEGVIVPSHILPEDDPVKALSTIIALSATEETATEGQESDV